MISAWRARASRPSRLATAAFCAVWVLLLASGAAATWRYQTRPGPPPADPVARRWPGDLELAREPGRATVVMFAHPRCPCTRASLAELRRAADQLPDADVIVLFSMPRDADGAWEETSTWEAAASIPGVRVVRDVNGAMARRLGATTSGHVTAFDRDGTLVFEGGITSSRGHEGESSGGRALLAAVRGGTDTAHAATYGCELVTP